MSRETLPEPPIPAGTSLRHYPSMMLDIERFKRSSFVQKHASSRPDIVLHALFLWMSAFHEEPAGSIPNDDRELMFLANFRGSLKKWLVDKPSILRGFSLHSDGRLYHHFLCEKIAFELENKTLRENRTAKARAKLAEKRSVTESVTESVEGSVEGGQGKGMEGNKKVPSSITGTSYPPSTTGPEAAPEVRKRRDYSDHGDGSRPPPKQAQLPLGPVVVTRTETPVQAPTDFKKILFDAGVPELESRGRDRKSAGAQIGRWLRSVDGDAKWLSGVILQAADGHRGNFTAWVESQIQIRLGTFRPKTAANVGGSGKGWL